MRFKKLTAIILIMCCALFSACANEDIKEENEYHMGIGEIDLDPIGSRLEENYTTAETEPVSEEETAAYPESFTYIDVKGILHAISFHSDWPLNSYDRNAFAYGNGGRMTYASDDYTYSLGIDVYDAYGTIDWPSVKADGYDFAMVRMGYRGYLTGELVYDANYMYYLVNAYQAGMEIGVYFFSQALNEEEARQEAEYVINGLTANGIMPENLTLGIAYDPEDVEGDSVRTKDLTGEQITKNAQAFCQRVEEAGYQARIYSNMVWEDENFDLSQLSDYEIWYADYTMYPQTPYAFTIWQYGHSVVAGVTGRVDVNIRLIPVQAQSEESTQEETEASQESTASEEDTQTQADENTSETAEDTMESSETTS